MIFRCNCTRVQLFGGERRERGIFPVHSLFSWYLDRKKGFLTTQDVASITRRLNVTDIVSRQTQQRASVPHLRKQAARYMGRITRSCTSGQNGAAAGVSIMAFRLRFPGAELSGRLQGNAYQSGRISIKALNPSPRSLQYSRISTSFPEVALITWTIREIMVRVAGKWEFIAHLRETRSRARRSQRTKYSASLNSTSTSGEKQQSFSRKFRALPHRKIQTWNIIWVSKFC